MKIGVDFDNTIVSYDKVFHKVALEKSLIKSSLTISKIAVRDYLRNKGQNDIWTELQGYVYGERMLDANVFPGFIEFLNFANKNSIEVLIISHKTIYPYLGYKYNLHDINIRFLYKTQFKLEYYLSLNFSNSLTFYLSNSLTNLR